MGGDAPFYGGYTLPIIPVTINVYKQPSELSDVEAGKIMRGKTSYYPGNATQRDALSFENQAGGRFIVPIHIPFAEIPDLELAEKALVSRRPQQEFDRSEDEPRANANDAGACAIVTGMGAVGLAGLSYYLTDDLMHSKSKTETGTGTTQNDPSSEPLIANPALERTASGACLLASFALGYAALRFIKKTKAMKQNLRDVLVQNDAMRSTLLESVQERLRHKRSGYDHTNLIN